MPITYVIDPLRRLVRSRAWGTFTDADFRAYKVRLAADPAFDPSYQQLGDLREVTRVELSSVVVADVAMHLCFSPRARRALVAREPCAYGVARMYELYAEAAGQQVRVFTDVDTAEAWLAGVGCDGQ